MSLDPKPLNSAEPFTAYGKFFLLLALSGLFVYLQAFRFPATPYFYEGDHLIFLHDAMRMAAGERIYSDFFQFTLPGTQLLYLLLIAIFGPKYLVTGVLILLIVIALFWLGLTVSRTLLHGSWAFLPPVIFVFFGMRWFGLDGTHRMISPVFLLLAIVSLSGHPSIFRAFLAGAACGMAGFFTQPRGVLGIAACVAFVLVDALQQRSAVRVALWRIASCLGGFALALLVACSYFIFTAGQSNLFYSTVIHPARHYGLHPDNTFAIYTRELGKAFEFTSFGGAIAAAAAIFYAVVVPVLTVAAAVYVFRLSRSRDWISVRPAALLATFSIILIFGTSAPMHLRLFSVSLPALALMVWMISETRISSFGQRPAWIAAALLILFGYGQVIAFQVRADVAEVVLPAGRVAVVEPLRHFERIIWLRDRLKPGEAVYEVYDPFVNFPLHAPNPSRFSQIFPYRYTPQEHVTGVIDDLLRTRPRFVVWDNSYNTTDRRTDDPTGPLAEFINKNYRPSSPVYMIGDHPVQVWELADSFRQE